MDGARGTTTHKKKTCSKKFCFSFFESEQDTHNSSITRLLSLFSCFLKFLHQSRVNADSDGFFPNRLTSTRPSLHTLAFTMVFFGIARV